MEIVLKPDCFSTGQWQPCMQGEDCCQRESSWLDKEDDGPHGAILPSRVECQAQPPPFITKVTSHFYRNVNCTVTGREKNQQVCALACRRPSSILQLHDRMVLLKDFDSFLCS